MIKCQLWFEKEVVWAGEVPAVPRDGALVVIQSTTRALGHRYRVTIDGVAYVFEKDVLIVQISLEHTDD
jgi:hypothetical protein